MDRDGVAYCYPREEHRGFKGYVEITPHFIPFLKQVHDLGYELRLLTFNPEGGRALMDAVQHSGSCEFRNWDLDKVPSCCFKTEFRNKLQIFDGERPSKASYVDLSRDFLWIEDGISFAEAKALLRSGRADCYRYVDNRSYGALWRCLPWIKGHPITRGSRRVYPGDAELNVRMQAPVTPAEVAKVPRGLSIRKTLERKLNEG